MSNNQNNISNTIYQYNVTANSSINYDDIKNPQKQNIAPKIIRPSISKSPHGPALARAMKALKLVNPFKGV